ncbi:hypothetical protein ES288_A12G174200v1 [Gossypium darwinii]|uniref:Uncharacterized protein n=1 Tax=Gossypium darwinii TaxID=34276 RepID=A0A5D2EA06_GOSDA|nr:hypothetical protein ES288_A12G174200v1 [Gossypium darwinii]
MTKRINIFKRELYFTFRFLAYCWIYCLSSVPVLAQNGPFTDHNNEISELPQAPVLTTYKSPSTLVLAGQRTNRPDLLRHFKHYHGGCNITNCHYWAIKLFTFSSIGLYIHIYIILELINLHLYAEVKLQSVSNDNRLLLLIRKWAVGLIFVALWSVSFGLVLLAYHYCRWRVNIKGKRIDHSQTMIGCILLSVRQDEFHGKVLHTLKYVVNQSDYTLQILNNLFPPSNVMTDIDKLNIDLNAIADTLIEKTDENAVKIRRVFNVRLALISVVAVMLILALLGLLLSVLGHQHNIHIFIVSGWLLVATTFILCGVFILLNNAISNTCLAMEEWVENPHAKTALSNILSYVDQRTTNHTLTQSKQVINSLVKVVNTYIYTFANSNPSPDDNHCQCESNEVSIANASLITPDRFMQLVAAVNESFAFEHYTPLLLCLQNCDFVRDMLQKIGSNYYHPLEHYLKIVNAGLGKICSPESDKIRVLSTTTNCV